MKLHDLKPAPGSRKARRRVGRGIAAGQGKTAGRGTKGQKARAGGTIPAWFEGGQTPLHQRIPKLHGFTNPFRIDFEVVNVGDINRLAEAGVFEADDHHGAKAPKGKAAPTTINQEILRAAGLVRRMDRPMKILGGGDLSAALFVVADAFTASARTKIEAAGGTVSVLEVPDTKRVAIGRDTEPEAGASAEPASAPADDEPVATAEPVEAVAAASTIDEPTEAAPVAKTPKARKPKAAKTDATEADA
jgi:large subunit ribosomal protein L15